MLLKKGTLERRALISLGFRVGIVIAVMTTVAYFHVVSSVTEQTLGQLEKYIIERGQRERSIFKLAEDNHAVLKAEILRRLNESRGTSRREEFERKFVRFDDGVTRNRLESFDGTREAFAYIGKDVVINDDIRRLVMTFLDLSNQYGPAWHHRLQNVYFTTPENILVGYWPDVPTWAHDATADLYMPEEEYVWVADKKNNPSRETAWTGLFYDVTGKIWMVSVETPVDLDGRQIATIGHDILLNEILDRTINSSLEGAYNIIFRDDGRLIAHPGKMDAIKQAQGFFDIMDSDDADLKGLFETVMNRPPGAAILESPDSKNYFAVTEIEEPGWYFVTVYPKKLVSKVAFGSARIILLLGLASLLLELAILFRVLRNLVTNPLNNLVRAVDQVASGDLELQLDQSRNDELGALAKSMSSMAQAVKRRSDQLIEARANLEQRVDERTKELRDSEENLAEAQRISGLGSFRFDVRTGKAVWSDERFRIFGYEPGEIEPTLENFRKSLHPDDRERVMSALNDSIRSGKSFNTESRIIRPDGEERIVHFIAEVHCDDEGAAEYMTGTVLDITERYRAEEELRLQEQRFRLVLDNALISIITIDEKGIVQSINTIAEKTFGYSSDEILGKNIKMLVPEPYNGGHDTYLENYVRGGDANIIGKGREVEGLRKDGTTFPMALGVSELTLSGRKLFTGIIRDLTYEKQMESGLYIAKEKADEANKTKSAFLANMSHELRTPLNAIIGFSGSLKEEMFGPFNNEKQAEYINDIHESGKHLLELINDILDVSAIEAGKLELSEENLDLEKVSEDITRLIQPQIKTSGVRIHSEIEDNLPLVFADERRIKQILLNLFSNAVKFTSDGGVVTLGMSLDESGALVITVNDTGIGMDENEIIKAMTEFGQIDSGLARKYEGTGLGLPLTKGLVELHGGTLKIESEKGVGTKVTVTLPKERCIESP